MMSELLGVRGSLAPSRVERFPFCPFTNIKPLTLPGLTSKLIGMRWEEFN